MEVKIQIPDNCELIKDGDTYVVREKKQTPPRSWKEFCENYPITEHEAMICGPSSIILAAYNVGKARRVEEDKNWIVSKEEAEAFLALMQLRQLRKAWVGDWEPIGNKSYTAITTTVFDKIETWEFLNTSKPLSFPTKEMAKNFLNCFRDLCETAKPLL